MMAQTKDYYSMLGLPRTATADEIRQSYYEAARRLHPDTNTAPGDTEFFLDIQQAYEVLSNPKKRAKYDLSLPPEITPTYPLDQRLIFSRPNLVHLEEPQLVYAILDISPPVNLQRQVFPAMNLCLVLDRSTSMQGGSMEQVKATAVQIMHKLKPNDIFSVVAFSDRAEVIIPASHTTDISRLEARIQMLQTSGGTEIFSGLDMGYNEIIRNVDRSKVNHIILLTDGRTYGDEDRCLDLARRAARHGIGISGLGIGPEWNDNLLDGLASATGGSSIYISKPQDIQKALFDKFNQLGRTYAEETRLKFKVPEGVELRYAFRIHPEAGILSNESPILLGPVIRETGLRMLMEFVVQPEAVRRKSIILLDGTLSANLTDGPNQTQPIPVKLTRPVSDDAGTDYPPSEIVDALSQLKLYRLQEQARIEVSAGDFKQASEHLQHLATHLLAQGERGLARTALLEAEHILQEKSFSQEGRKEIKYGTRALLMSGRRSEEQ